MKVSIALCTYNGGKYLDEQLDSFLSQTRQPDELIICDDRSTDNTLEITRVFAKTSPFRVRMLQNEHNLGSSKNFEKAVSLCAGEIVFLSDQDDVWKQNKIEMMLAEFERGPDIGLVYSNAAVVKSNLDDLGIRLWDTVKTTAIPHNALDKMGLEALLLHRNYVTGATTALRSEIVPILREHPIPKGVVHDHWIAILAALRWKIVAVDEDLILYRQHAGQQIGARLPPSLFTLPSKKPRDERLCKLLRDLEDQLGAFRRLLSFGNDVGGDGKTRQRRLLQRKLDAIDRCLSHFRVRSSLSEKWYQRFFEVFRELGTRRYFACSAGFKSVLTDLVRR